MLSNLLGNSWARGAKGQAFNLLTLKNLLSVTKWETDSLGEVMVVPNGRLVLPIQLISLHFHGRHMYVTKEMPLMFACVHIRLSPAILTSMQHVCFYRYLHSGDTVGFL